MEKVNLAEAFRRFSDHWSPKIVGEVDNMHVKVVKLKGEFVMHQHEEEDEMFLVVDGKLVMRFRDRDVEVGPGEFIIVPHGTEHQPIAVGETQVVLFERKGTLNTGNVRNERTVEDLERI